MAHFVSLLLSSVSLTLAEKCVAVEVEERDRERERAEKQVENKKITTSLTS